MCVNGVSSFCEFCIGVGNSPQIQQSLQLQEMFLSFSFSPKPQCSVRGSTALLAWLPVCDTVHSGIAAQPIPALPQQGALGWSLHLPQDLLRHIHISVNIQGFFLSTAQIKSSSL